MAGRVLDWLYVGDKTVAKDRALLRQLNVRYVLNVTPPRTEGGVANFFEKEGSIEYLRLPLRDLNTESVLPLLPAAVEFLRRAHVRDDGCALVHCNEGRSRSVALVTGFLVLTRGLSSSDALALVREVRPRAEPKEAFVRQLATLTPTIAAGGNPAASAASASAASAAPAAAQVPKRPADGALPAPKRVVGPQLPPHMQRGSPEGDVPAPKRVAGPQLPPHMQRRSPEAPDDSSATIGPAVPGARPLQPPANACSSGP